MRAGGGGVAVEGDGVEGWVCVCAEGRVLVAREKGVGVCGEDVEEEEEFGDGQNVGVE